MHRRARSPLWAMSLVLAAAALTADCSSAEAPSDAPAAASPNAPQIRASRLFAGPDQYPPVDFAAYGILAFRAEATSNSRSRYLAICEGYLAGLPPASELEARGVPLKEQMATVWPLDNAALADDLNASSASNSDQIARCSTIVDNIDTVLSRDAIVKASRSDGSTDFTGDGPYLIAWSPATTFGQPDALVLVWDLSGVTTAAQATRMFADWAVEIERNPDLWRNGWDRERVRTVLRLWADRWGSVILRAIGFEN